MMIDGKKSFRGFHKYKLEISCMNRNKKRYSLDYDLKLQCIYCVFLYKLSDAEHPTQWTAAPPRPKRKAPTLWELKDIANQSDE